jgi:hypothetical protein
VPQVARDRGRERRRLGPLEEPVPAASASRPASTVISTSAGLLRPSDLIRWMSWSWVPWIALTVTPVAALNPSQSCWSVP